jgi:hypothetical protein
MSDDNNPYLTHQSGDRADQPKVDIAKALGGVADASEKSDKTPAELAAEKKSAKATQSKNIAKRLGG